jgi:exodeoxyribonuclease-3
MLKIASWNVNSLNVRLEQVLNWLDSAKADVLALQEIKLIDAAFPVEAFTSRGYFVVYSGQKTYNGVAIISRKPLTDVQTDMPDFNDPQRRILAASIGDLRLINLYVPNGSEVGSEKYAYKLDWLASMHQFLSQQVADYSKLAVVGDFNIAPADLDVHDPTSWEGSVHVSEAERQIFSQIIALGLKDSFRHFHTDSQLYSWWDYRQGGFRRNLGLRIDHILLTGELMAQCIDAGIDDAPRRNERPSDHTPVWALLDLD